MAANLIFISGSTNDDVRCAVIYIPEDNALEGNQTFTMTLTTPDPNVLLGTDLTIVTIADNDGKYIQRQLL